jgi:hypothetical protein
LHGNKALKRTKIYSYDIIKKVKKGKPVAEQRGFNMKRRIKNSVFVTNITAAVESDWCATIRKLARAHGMSTKTIHATLPKDLNLSKKSAR